jgi:nitrogen fixation protein FixH
MTLRWHWGTAIACVYVTFALGTVTMVAIAVRQRTDLVTPDYYAASLRHDAHTVAAANARALGDALSIRLMPALTSTQLRIELPEAIAARAVGTVTLYRAADASADRQIPLAPDGGVQIVNVTGLATGVWHVQVEWTADGRAYYTAAPIVIR